jgi:TonB-dependent receptor
MKTNDAPLAGFDLLPSAGLIYSVTTNMNVRLNYSQTIARPSFRELAAYYSYDPIVSDFVEGNPRLKMSAIENYDLRWEWFPHPGELFSVSLFYKDLKNAIERGNVKGEGDVITFFNNDAKLYGIEFEARKNLNFLGPPFSPFSLGGNLSLVESEAKLSTNDLTFKRQFFPNISTTRPLYDQSPYVLNLDLNYSTPRSGTSATLIYNVAGPRIAITKLNTDDVYEQPVPGLDFIISQKIGRHATVKFAAKNLLDPRIERTYGKSSSLLYSSYTRGRAFGMSLTYDF